LLVLGRENRKRKKTEALKGGGGVEGVEGKKISRLRRGKNPLGHSEGKKQGNLTCPAARLMLQKGLVIEGREAQINGLRKM